MTIAILDDHLALLDAVRRFTASRCSREVVRAAAEADSEQLPPFWDELVGLGWLRLHLGEDDGGEGYGFGEIAVVLEELGRVLAPGPALPTVWASAVIAAAGAPVGRLATGGVGTVALCPPLDARRRDDGSVVVAGTIGPVLCGGLADVFVVPLHLEGRERWCVLDRDDVVVTPMASLDLTRRLAGADVLRTEFPATRLLGDISRSRVLGLGTVLTAAECAGGSAWCVGTASSYAAEREQFGRPIGQFQGVKHRCADMLVALEQTRAVAWDGAAALDGDVGEDELELVAGVAGSVAPEAFTSVAKDCIQVLGGIGFTWEHDAHLYLRRSASLRQMLGSPAVWRRRVGLSALGGVRRRLTVTLPPEAEALRGEVRAFAEEVAALAKDQQRQRLTDAGYVVPHWPPPWGRGATAVEQLVIDEELRRVRVRIPHLAVGAWAAATIAAHGTPEQQERWVRPTVLGSVTWCQLFSEPSAGSDLAALRTTGTRTEGGWLVNGQKVWTTMAAEADWGICLVRTNPNVPKHLGITYLIVDMRAAGIDVRPLKEMTGLEMFNEVFFDDVFVPDDCVIGDVDAGWPLARTTLANERVVMGRGSSFGGGVEALLRLVLERFTPEEARSDAVLVDQLGGIVAEAQTVALLGARSTQRSVSGDGSGAEASVRKLLSAEHDQRVQELGLIVLGPDGATTEGDAGQWTFGFLANRCLTIAGGTSEIQRNVIAERLLGLPRDPERDA